MTALSFFTCRLILHPAHHCLPKRAAAAAEILESHRHNYECDQTRTDWNGQIIETALFHSVPLIMLMAVSIIS